MKQAYMRVVITITILIFACAFNFKNDAPSAIFKKLKGTWKMQKKNGMLYEQWSITNATHAKGKSYIVKGKDSTMLEFVTLTQHGNSLLYIPVTANQNDGNPITFTGQNSTTSTFVFENKQHDFPKRIVYKFVGNDSIHAFIDDGIDGSKKRSDYYYKRVK